MFKRPVSNSASFFQQPFLVPTFLILAIALCNIATAQDRLPADAKKALESAESIEFFSIHPEVLLQAEGADDVETEMFQNYRVLGKTAIAEETMQSLLEAFIKGVNDNDGTSARCFNPRHGIRVEFDEKVYEFVICFECLQVQWHVDGEKQTGFLVTESPKAEFNKILKDAEVPLPGK